ncbi:MAG: hypothetical protein Q3990_08610 [Desulfovibrionaceae bacterium]|nr:hypothetical protein [Desulfovibrionaceae bacterium]
MAGLVLTANPIPGSVLATEAGLVVQGTKANVLPAEMAATVALEENSSLIQAYMRGA